MDEFTVGVEEEYQLVHARTGDLQSRARSVLEADWTGDLRKELQESTVEIGTAICRSAAEVERELKRLRFQTAAAASSEGMQIVAAGLHPTSRWERHRLTADARYAQIAEDYGRIARDEHNFGMHIHVAVPEGLDCIPLLNSVRFYLPHLLALSCSSPFYEGGDTGYSSFRMILWRRWPNSGVPPAFASRREYREHVDLLLRSGVLGDERSLYWSVRPHPAYPTLEFRVTDACPRLADATAIAALARALVAAAADGLLDPDPWPNTSRGLGDAILGDNEWRASRHGLNGTLVDPNSDGGAVPVRDAIRELLERLAPFANALGDGAELERIDAILERGNGAERARSFYEECGTFRELVAWLQAETMLGTGIDRRQEHRAQCAPE